MWIAGDSADAKAVVTGILHHVGWKDHVIDAGGIAESRLLEQLAMLSVTLCRCACDSILGVAALTQVDQVFGVAEVQPEPRLRASPQSQVVKNLSSEIPLAASGAGVARHPTAAADFRTPFSRPSKLNRSFPLVPFSAV